MSAMPKRLQKLFAALIAADTVFWLLPPLMLLLVAGTLAQRDMGLWPAIDKYFSGFILWIGPLPLPGAFTLLGILGISLTLRFVFQSEWRKSKAGIHITHLGIIVLLLGGLLTALTAKEYYMIIPEGQETPYIYSYTQRTLSIYKDKTPVFEGNFKDIENWNFSSLPFNIEPVMWCENCEITARSADNIESFKGMAKNMAFVQKRLDAQPELNLTGIEFKLRNTEQDGAYIAFDGMPNPIEFTAANEHFTLIFGKTQQTLPFELKLTDFKNIRYPGIDKTKNYISEIILKDGKSQWPVTIEMNEPLRYGGYTFFQSSFEETPEQDITILAVVENKGRLFPYIGTILMALGLIMHIVIMFKNKSPT